MRHWKIQLFSGNKVTKEWGLWASELTVGAGIRDKVFIAPPFPLKALKIQGNGDWEYRDAAGSVRNGHADSLTEPMRFSWGTQVVEILEDTPVKGALWAKAREHMAYSLKMAWKEPGADKANNRIIAMAVLAFLAVGSMTGMAIFGSNKKSNDSKLPDVVVELVKQDEKKEEEKKEEPKPQDDPSGASDQKPTNPNEGGATEVRTVAWPPNNPSSVMNNSVMDKINTASDGLLGEAVDASQENVVDAILAGGGGSLKKGSKGGRGASGDGDRMGGMGGVGFGTGGRAGWGTGNGGTRQGKMALGAGGTGKGISTRAKINPPKPSDVELGGEAGSRSPESILRVIRAHIGGFRYTYEKYLKQNPNIGGKISLKFTISPAGDIIAISVASSNTGNGELDDEIKDKARRMKFDPIEKGNVTVTYAFVLDKN